MSSSNSSYEFERLSWWYYRSKKLNKCKGANISTDTMFTPSFVKICYLVRKLLGGEETDIKPYKHISLGL
jgi:hypothetical protein